MTHRNPRSLRTVELSTGAAFLLCLILSSATGAEPLFVVKNYDGFTVYIDCRQNGPIAYELVLKADVGNVPRPASQFNIDSSIPADCQMTTGDTFQVTDEEEDRLGR